MKKNEKTSNLIIVKSYFKEEGLQVKDIIKQSLAAFVKKEIEKTADQTREY